MEIENEEGDDDEEEGEGDGEPKEADTPAEGAANGESTPTIGETSPQKVTSEALPTADDPAGIAALGDESQTVNPATALEIPSLPEPESDVPSVPVHQEMPSNAMEISNIAPGHTEQGEGDLGGSVAGVEIHLPEAAGGDVEMAESKVQVDMSALDAGVTTEDSAMPERDEGLVMGDMESHAELTDGPPPPDIEQPLVE